MSPRTILVIFLSLFFLELVWELCLLWLNLRRGLFEEGYRWALEYSRSKTYLSVASSLASSGLVLLLVLSGWLGALESRVSSLVAGPIIRAILYVYLVALIFAALSLPVELYGQFVIEVRYGFSRMTWKLFVLDRLKGLAVSLGLTTPLLAAVFLLIRASPLWWLWSFALFTAFQLVMIVLYPKVIAPLFNKFSPLQDGSLRDRILSLAGRLGFRTRGIFVMDGSRRSRHSNAYFSGLGKVKRIVLFDTLVQALPEEEVAAVLAHEIGHEKLGHIIKRLALSIPSRRSSKLSASQGPAPRPCWSSRPSYPGPLLSISGRSFPGGPGDTSTRQTAS